MTHRIHLSIVQPLGYIHSLGFLDQARYARYQFRQLGAEVTLGKNRLREDAINIIFGAHLGFPAQLKDRYTCVFFNLEQLGEGGAIVSKDYINLLSSSAVIDYDERNLSAYGCANGDIPIVSFQFAPYLASTPILPFEDRPIDLLFYGGVNERRQAIFERIEACGWNVSRFDHPLFSEERDQFISQSKAVFNCHFYESSRFEQARAFHTLSLGTPLVSERTDRTSPPMVFEDAVSWVTDDDLETFFTHEFMTPQWEQRAKQQLLTFALNNPAESWRIAFSYCQALWGMDGREKALQIWQPTRMNLGSDKDYKLGWLNVDLLERVHPDVVLDFDQELKFPIEARTMNGVHVVMHANSLEIIQANNVLAHASDLRCLMTNLLGLLKEGGQLELDLHDPQSMRNPEKQQESSSKLLDILNQFTDYFWHSGWFDHRLEIESIERTDNQAYLYNQIKGHILRVRMKKVATSLREKTVARVMMTDFTNVSNDFL